MTSGRYRLRRWGKIDKAHRSFEEEKDIKEKIKSYIKYIKKHQEDVGEKEWALWEGKKDALKWVLKEIK